MSIHGTTIDYEWRYQQELQKQQQLIEIIENQLTRLHIFENYIDDMSTSTSAVLDFLLIGWDTKEEDWNVSLFNEHSLQMANRSILSDTFIRDQRECVLNAANRIESIRLVILSMKRLIEEQKSRLVEMLDLL